MPFKCCLFKIMIYCSILAVLMQLEKFLIASLGLEYHSQILKIKKNLHRRNLIEIKSFLTSFLPSLCPSFPPFFLPVIVPGHPLVFINLILFALGFARCWLFWVVLEGKKFSYPVHLESEWFPDYSVGKNVKVSLHKMESGISKVRCSSLCSLFHSLERYF